MTSRRSVLGMLAAAVVAPPLLAGPASAATIPGVSPWSVSPSWGSSGGPSVWAGTVARIGVRNVRGFRADTGGYDQIRAAGLTSTGILQWSPAGAFRFPVDDVQGWKAYVARMVRTYPAVRQWEVWNEPPNFSADPSPASYAAILRAAWDTAKALDPTVQLGLATKATNTAWLREALLAGAAGHYDYVTVHPYERAGAIVDGWEEPFLAIVPQLRSMLSETDAPRAGVPIQFTEVGTPAAQHPGREDGTSTPQFQARTLTKVLTMAVAQGVQRVSWYDPFDGDYDAGEAAFGLIARDGTPRPAFHAYGNLVAALGDRPVFVGLLQPQPDTFQFVFRRPDGTAAVVGWTRGAKRSMAFSGRVKATSATTGVVTTSWRIPLTSDPVIVVVPTWSGSQDWMTRAAAARVKRSAVRTSVSWDAGSGASGLHVRGLSSGTVVDGRAVLAPAGSVVQIAVGPDVDLKASAVKVTALVRGVQGRPGFNLKYDVDAPLSALDWAGQRLGDGGWRHVGTGTWTSLTWTLTDVRFAGMYGFNLRLDSDSSEYDDYQIASLSLEVLTSRGAPVAP